MQPQARNDSNALAKDEICARLVTLESALRARKVVSLALFGSVARDEASEDSDIDIVIDTCGPFSLLDLSAVLRFLEEQLGRPVDVIHHDNVYPTTPLDALRPKMRAALMHDLTPVF